MAKIKLNGDTSGYIEISAPAVSGNNTLELGPGTKILTNLDNTFTGITTFSNGIHITSGGFILNQQRSDTHASLIIDKPDAGTGTLKFFNNGSASAYIQHTNSEHLNYYLPSGSGSQVFYTNATERLRIASDGQATFDKGAVGGANQVIARFQAESSRRLDIVWHDSGSLLGFDLPGSHSYIFKTAGTERLRIATDGDLTLTGADNVEMKMKCGTSSGNNIIAFLNSSGTTRGNITYDSDNNFLLFNVNQGERLRIGSDGHLSYKNSSPPAWSTDSGYANATLGSSAYFRTDTDPNSNFLSIGCNAYRGSSTWQHVNSGYATQLQMSANDGNLTYYTSTVSGSAGNSITWNEVIRMTLNEVGINVTPSAGDGATYNNWSVPKLHVKGNSDSNKFHLVGRFVSGNDADNTGAQIVIHHENDRGMALQGGRSVSNRSYGAIKSLDNLSREATVMDFRGNPGQGVQYIKFYTGASNSTTEQLTIDSSGRIFKPNQPRFFAWGNTSTNMTTTGFHTWDTFNNTRFNIGNHFSTSTYLFTAPVDGTYAFGCNCRIDAGGVGYFRLILSINGSSADNDQAHSIRNADAANASYHSQEITALYQLSANDNVRVLVNSSSDTSWQMQSESQFWGYLVA